MVWSEAGVICKWCADELALIKVTDVDGHVGFKLEDGMLCAPVQPNYCNLVSCSVYIFDELNPNPIG